jgi:phytoene dehydrogenase-like protein
MGEAGRTVIVVGGGLGGLIAATLAARRGARVQLLEKARRWGGRARSEQKGGAWLNLGAHALYERGELRRVLTSLGVAHQGGRAPARGALALAGERLATLPVGAVSLLMTDLLSPSEKLLAARLLARAQRGGPPDSDGLTVAQWLERIGATPALRGFLGAAMRVATYCHAPELQGARAALDQVALGAAGVRYLHGGWQQLVDGLERAADAAGVARRQVGVACVLDEAGRAVGVELKGGERLLADAIVLAMGPGEARDLVPASRSLAAAADAATPVQASCLDLVLDRVPNPSVRLCLGFDEPLYFSLHSSVANLVDRPAGVVHLARYLAPGEHGNEEVRDGLMRFAERVQPGILDVVREARYLPHMTVTHAVVGPGGLAARSSPRVPDLGGLFVAGDWVGPRGQLADATAASAEDCAALATGTSSGARGGRELAA